MPYTFEDLVAHQRRRWMRPNVHLWVRPDAHRFMRPDAARFVPPGTNGWGHPDEKLWDFHAAHRRRTNPPWLLGDNPSPAAELARLQVQHDSIQHAFVQLRQERRRQHALERAESERLKQRWDAAWDRLTAALNRHWDACRKAGFDPNQPRVPAGNPDGGQWTSGGGASGSDTRGDNDAGNGINDSRILSDATPDNNWIPGAQYAQNETERHRSVILEDEPRFKHIKDRHIKRSDDDLLDVLKKSYYRGYVLYGFQPAEGTFVDVRSANDLINQTLQANSALVDRVAAGEVSEATLEHRFGYRTGREAFRPDVDADPYIRSAYGVRVVIRHDPQRKTGYRLLTAYPINKRKK